MDLRTRITALMPQAYEELAELVAMRSVADPRQFPAEGCERAASWVRRKFSELGFTDAHLAETDHGSPAVVVGSRACADPHAPTVLLYAHYDVQPPLDEAAWHTPPFQLTEVDGRWHARGAADCKGNILMHLTAIRALGDDIPVNLKVLIEGSEELGPAGVDAYVANHPELFRAEAILIADTGNAAVGRPAITVSLRGGVIVVVTVEALSSAVHNGMFGGAAPDALAALVAMLASLRDSRGNTTVAGLDNTQTWRGEPYQPEKFRADAGVLEGVALLGDGRVSDMLWARPALTVVGIDCPPVVGSAMTIAARAAALLHLRVPPGMAPDQAETALIEHLHAAAPWGVRVTVKTEATPAPFQAAVDGPAYQAMSAAMLEAYGTPMTTLGQGGTIPLCNTLAETYPGAELILIGVQEPLASIHAPNESVDPNEIAAMALSEALFLQRCATAWS